MLLPVLTVRQPWAALIVNGLKNVENRNWRLPDKYRNTTVLIHSSAKPAFDDHAAVLEMGIRGFSMKLEESSKLSGLIIGAVRFSSCEEWPGSGGNAPSPWCDNGSAFWWMIDKAILLPPIAAKGRLNFWKFDFPRFDWPEGWTL